MKVALVGHGSIGSRYKDSLIKNHINIEDIVIIEKNSKLIEELRKENFNCYEDLLILKREGLNIDYGIVANWGPQHIKTANQLIDIGCKRIIIEKPVSSRIDELESFKKRCINENIFITVHHHWNYTDIIDKIENAQIKYNLGEPVGIRFIGGAVCLSTNGTHYFDLGCKILKSSPKQVCADLELDYINPRDKKLVNIGGMASYRMKNDSFIHVSFSNNNSQSFRSEIVYRHGIIKISTDIKLKVFKRNDQDIIKFGHKITRYGDLNFIGDIAFKDILTLDSVLENLFYGDKPKVSLDEAEISVKMVLAAIQSHLNGKKVMFDNIIDTDILIS